jgi:hypothetical protein
LHEHDLSSPFARINVQQLRDDDDDDDDSSIFVIGDNELGSEGDNDEEEDMSPMVKGGPVVVVN